MMQYENSIISEGFLFNNGKYEVIKNIGEGGFGFVFEVKDRDCKDEPRFALKMIKNVFISEEEINEYLKEIEMLKEYRNKKHLVNYIEHFFDINVKRLCIITTLYRDGDLEGLIESYKKEQKKFKPLKILFYSDQVLSGLEYLHKNEIVHRDLKPKNIFRVGDSLVIGDLGLAKKYDQIRSSTKFAGSINYISPECIKGDSITTKSDIWSFGCILYELTELNKAFGGDVEFEIMNKIVSGDIPKLDQPYLKKILLECLNRNPDRRKHASDLVVYVREKFNEINKEEMENSLKKTYLNEKKCVKTLVGHEWNVNALINLGEGRIASASGDKTIKIWNVNEAKCLKTLRDHELGVFALINIRGGKIASGSGDKTIKIWDWAEEKCLKTYKGHTDCVNALENLENGKIVSGSSDGTIKVWNIDECEKTLKAHKKGVLSLLSLGKCRIASGSSNEQYEEIKIWNVAEGLCTHKLQSNDKGGLCALINLEDGKIASCSNNATIKIWNWKEKKCKKEFKGHGGSVNGLVNLGDGKIASGGDDNTIKVLDIKGKCIQTLEGHDSYVLSLVNLGEGRIASGSKDETIKIWNL